MAVTDQLGLNLLLVFAVATMSSVNAIRCYTCNSNDNSECLAPPTTFTEEEYRDNRTVPARLLVECPPDEQGRAAFCRKISLNVRECGYERARRPCYAIENGGHEEDVCQCFTDACNGGSQISIAGVWLVAISVGLLLGCKRLTL